MTPYLIGFIIGVLTGCLFYAKILDKPEVVNKINKQKVRKGGFLRNIFKTKND